jgi:hypothetical protein
MPVDVIVVDKKAGDRRVPVGRLGCLEVVFLLNEDMWFKRSKNVVAVHM